MKSTIAVALCALLTACAVAPRQSPDPYPGSGGLFLGTPSQAEIDSGRINFTPKRFSAFRVGATTKAEVVKKLGKPAGWMTKSDGTSELEYDYMGESLLPGMRRVIYTFFTFDSDRILSEMQYPGYEDRKKSGRQ